MRRRERVEVVHELEAEVPIGWRWRPQLVEEGEAQRLLQRDELRQLPDSARLEILESAQEIVGRCVPPAGENHAQDTGIVVGYVQSGKTLSFTTVAALACDNDFPLIIVLSGTKKNLYTQTVKRLRRDLDLERPAGRWSIFQVQTRNPDLSQQLSHLLEQWDEGELPGFPRRTALITVLKTKQRICALVESLRHLDLGSRPCLIIDDEADQHGLNTNVRQTDMGAPYSAVYSALLDLRAALPRHTYVQYTATPQALLLISVLDALSPQFGWVLPAGAGYCGGDVFFDKDDVSRLVETISDEDLAVADDTAPYGPPSSLLEALRLFYIGVAVQAVHRGCNEPTQPYRSMLVHPSMRQMDHFRFKKWVENASESWIELLSVDSGDPDRDELVDEFFSAYKKLVVTVAMQLEQNEDHETVPPFDEILVYLPASIRSTRIWEVNSRRLEEWTQENWQTAHSHILVGGENLGRGFTVEGLTTTYMPRGRGGGVADTIQQRGRFFGYKQNYLGLCRVFLPCEVKRDYENYVDHETFVMEELGQLSQSGSSMLDWRRQMLLAQSLRPTRRSVMPDKYRHVKVSEWTQQRQPWMSETDSEIYMNWNIIEEFTGGLEFHEDSGSDQRTIDQRNAITEEVSLESILEQLLLPMWFAPFDAPKFSAAELVIQWHLNSNPDATATVYRMAAQRSPRPGGGTRRRGIRNDGRLVNLFQGEDPADPPEARGSPYPGDRNIHATKSVTVQIHDLDLTDRARPPRLLRGHVPVIAVWIPRSMRVDVFEEIAP